MKSRLITALAGSALVALVSSSAFAQRQAPPTPEQRIDRLERQIQQMQRQVFPKGRPADTAGFLDEPAATQSSVISIAQRVDALERQLSELVRQSEENGNRLRSIESALTQLRSDQERRIAALEQRIEAAAAAPQAVVQPVEQPAVRPSTTPAPRPAAPRQTTPPARTTEAAPTPTPGALASAAPASDPAEDAYTEGFRLWEAGNYDAAITSLRAFVAAYPRHRRTSFANNLIGRALLDKGQPRAAAEALLANYRSNPAGERAADSLYYLGQALTRLGQQSQACKSYAELDAVYGSKVRADLRRLVDEAKAQGQCG